MGDLAEFGVISRKKTIKQVISSSSSSKQDELWIAPQQYPYQRLVELSSQSFGKYRQLNQTLKAQNTENQV